MIQRYLILLLVLLGQLSLLPTAQAGQISFFKYLQKHELEEALLDDPFGDHVVLDDPFLIEPTVDNVVVNQELLVHLIYGREDRSDIDGNFFGYRIDYEISYGPISSNLTQTGSLEIYYRQDEGVYQAVNQHPFDDPWAKFRVTSICRIYDDGTPDLCLGGSTTDLGIAAEDIRVELELRSEKIYELGNLAQSTLNHEAEYVEGLHSKIDIGWSFAPGFEEYELEYVFWDSEATDEPQPGIPDYNIHLFKKAVRIETWRNNYTIDASYPSGTLYFRVRPVGRFKGSPSEYEIKKYGRWSVVESEVIGENETLQPFEPEKNWQFSTSFAEDGKNKKVLTYFDGSLRGRQVITHLNDEDVSLVAETDYSLEGQGVLSILPSPAIDGDDNFFFKERFNQDAEGNAYGYNDFDKADGATALSTVSGAGRYFSADNDYGGLYRDFVPDAEGFPLTQSRYLRDATGRMTAQSGVGNFHRLGQGRDTRYYYLNASATELHRLFGSNVGNSSHYKKNIIVDPNGQVSVSYLDQGGAVIATALAGTAPDNVIPLDNITLATTTKALNPRDEDSSTDLMSRSSNQLFNDAVQKTYNFKYNLTGAFNELLLNQTTLCTTCEYELTIYIKDPEGNFVDLSPVGGSTTSVLTQQYPVNTPSEPCADGSTYATTDVEFSATFEDIGTYEVIKELRVIGGGLNIEGLEETLSSTLPNLQQLIDEAVAQIDFSDCDWSCESYCHRYIVENCTECFDAQGEVIQAIYDQNMAACNPDMCLEAVEADNPIFEVAESECESRLEEMMAQVSPGGVFYNSSSLTSLNSLEFIVYDTDGNKFKIQDGVITVLEPGLDSNTPLYLRNQSTFTDDLVSNANDFLTNFLFDEDYWQGQWARILVERHREYCLYRHCQQINLVDSEIFSFAASALPPDYETSYEYDLRMARATHWSEFDASLVWNPNNPTSFLNYFLFNDPAIILTGAGTGYYNNPMDDCLDPLGYKFENALPYALLNYTTDQLGVTISIFEMIEAYIDDQDDPGTNGDPDEPYYNATPTQLDAVRWQLFRGAYADTKQRLLWTCFDDGTCDFYSDNNAVFTPPPQFPDNDGQDMTDWINNNVLTVCDDLCEGQADLWISQIENYLFSECLPLSPNSSWENDRASVRLALVNFCQGSCTESGLGNSFIVEILETDLTNDINLIFVNTVLDNYDDNCPASPGGVIVSDYTDYTLALPPECLQTITESINENILPLAGNGNPNPQEYTITDTDPDYNCYQRILLNAQRRNVQVSYNAFDCENANHILIFISDDSDLITYDMMESIDVETYSYTDLPPTVLDDYPNPQGANPTAIDFSGYTVEIELTASAGGGTVLAYLFNSKQGDCFGTSISSAEQEQADCEDYLIAQVTAEVTEQWQEQVDQILSDYYNSLSECRFVDEEFAVSYDDGEYHYTLYYYDQARNLVQTIPPNGVMPLGSEAFDTYGNWDGVSEPDHHPHEPSSGPDYRTVYTYNSLEQVVEQNTPDAGRSVFLYNEASQLRFSQNARQEDDEHWSYNRYDDQGRSIETGQLQYTSSASVTAPSPEEIDDPFFPVNSTPDYTTNYRIETTYDSPAGNQNTFSQENLRSRVSQVNRSGIETRYSYDVHGNVNALENFIYGLGRKKTYYEYDLVSGNVNEISYQSGIKDEFYHRYEYDADNRLTHVYTSDDGVIWDNDARYFYYLHGPMARTELGQDKVQGLDYYYTLHGWIKGVNMPSKYYNLGDPGADGQGGINRYQGWDQMAYTLGYYRGDYTRISNSPNLDILHPYTWDQFAADPNHGVLGIGDDEGLFNGNIAWMITDIPDFNKNGTPGLEGTQAMIYQYDQLHRIKKARSHEIGSVNLFNDAAYPGNPYVGIAWGGNNDYDTEYSYDGNGNLLNLKRNGPLSTAPMDHLTYHYGGNAGGPNRLRHVKETSSISSTVYSDDVENQGDDNYEYDEIGNLIEDASEQISRIHWTPYGKVWQVKFNALGHAAGKKDIRYTYDTQGNRLKKSLIQVTYLGGGAVTTETVEETYYSRSPDGQLLSLYKFSTRDGALRQEEVPIYGSSRLGLQRFSDRVMNTDGSSLALLESRRGDKVFELSNHLGNTLATVSDQKHGVDTGPAGDADWYLATTKSGSDYYPFGLAMNGRQADAGDYRYGFNGKENDRDWGTKWIQDYGFRLYNPSIGKFLSVDPLTASYPFYTPYQFAGNKPIAAVDLDGLEEDFVFNSPVITRVIIKILNDETLSEKQKEFATLALANYWEKRGEWPDIKDYKWLTDKAKEVTSLSTGSKLEASFPNKVVERSSNGTTNIITFYGHIWIDRDKGQLIKLPISRIYLPKPNLGENEDEGNLPREATAWENFLYWRIKDLQDAEDLAQLASILGRHLTNTGGVDGLTLDEDVIHGDAPSDGFLGWLYLQLEKIDDDSTPTGGVTMDWESFDDFEETYDTNYIIRLNGDTLSRTIKRIREIKSIYKYQSDIIDEKEYDPPK